MRPRVFAALLALIVVFTLARIAMTHRVFAQTQDESWHIISGYDVLTKWSFKSDLHHPPLARVLFALPFLSEPDPVADGAQARGNILLLRNDRYTQNLARMRLGNLPFVALAIIVVALWGRRLLSPAAGLVAALLFASTPQVLANGGLATTDIAIAATLPLALYALTLVLDEPSWKRTAFLGIAIAAGALAKFSFLPYFPVCAAILILVRRRFPIARIAAALALAFVLCWSVYRFDFGTIQGYDPRADATAQQIFGSTRIANIPLPAHAYFAGVLEVKKQDFEGQKAFLFDDVRTTGWWYYFPVALFFKTPIPLLLLSLAGAIVLLVRRQAIEIVLLACAILAIAMTSHINIGVRHVLPIYAPLAIAAAAAVVELRRVRIISFALVAWLLVGVALAHPDYLPWVNAFAGKEPHRVLNDSNLDWGQDVLRLVRLARTEKIPHITTALVGTAPLDRIGLPPRTDLIALQPVHGHVAISELMLALGREYSPEVRRWIDATFGDRPYRRVGSSIRLYELE